MHRHHVPTDPQFTTARPTQASFDLHEASSFCAHGSDDEQLKTPSPPRRHCHAVKSGRGLHREVARADPPRGGSLSAEPAACIPPRAGIARIAEAMASGCCSGEALPAACERTRQQASKEERRRRVRVGSAPLSPRSYYRQPNPPSAPGAIHARPGPFAVLNCTAK